MSKRAEIRERRKRERRRQRTIIILVVVAAALVVTALLIWPNIKPIGEVSIPTSIVYPMPDGTAVGETNAPVVIEEFSDFRCSFCRTFHETTLTQIIDLYVSTGKARIVFRNYPILGRESNDAANASLCAAEQNKFWEYASILFANQTGGDPDAYSARRFQTYAETLGLDTDQFTTCLRENRYQDQILESMQAALDQDLDSTPSFLINGDSIVGAVPFESFQEKIEAALAASG
jgi:protein-disulfide isomerase